MHKYFIDETRKAERKLISTITGVLFDGVNVIASNIVDNVKTATEQVIRLADNTVLIYANIDGDYLLDTIIDRDDNTHSVVVALDCKTDFNLPYRLN